MLFASFRCSRFIVSLEGLAENDPPSSNTSACIAPKASARKRKLLKPFKPPSRRAPPTTSSHTAGAWVPPGTALELGKVSTTSDPARGHAQQVRGGLQQSRATYTGFGHVASLWDEDQDEDKDGYDEEDSADQGGRESDVREHERHWRGNPAVHSKPVTDTAMDLVTSAAVVHSAVQAESRGWDGDGGERVAFDRGPRLTLVEQGCQQANPTPVDGDDRRPLGNHGHEQLRNGESGEREVEPEVGGGHRGQGMVGGVEGFRGKGLETGEGVSQALSPGCEQSHIRSTQDILSLFDEGFQEARVTTGEIKLSKQGHGESVAIACQSHRSPQGTGPLPHDQPSCVALPECRKPSAVDMRRAQRSAREARQDADDDVQSHEQASATPIPACDASWLCQICGVRGSSSGNHCGVCGVSRSTPSSSVAHNSSECKTAGDDASGSVVDHSSCDRQGQDAGNSEHLPEKQVEEVGRQEDVVELGAPLDQLARAISTSRSATGIQAPSVTVKPRDGSEIGAGDPQRRGGNVDSPSHGARRHTRPTPGIRMHMDLGFSSDSEG